MTSWASCLVVSFSHHTELILSLAFQGTPRGILSKTQIRKLSCFSYSFLQNLKRNHYQITQVTFSLWKLPELLSWVSETPFLALSQKWCLLCSNKAENLKYCVLREERFLTKHQGGFHLALGTHFCHAASCSSQCANLHCTCMVSFIGSIRSDLADGRTFN